MSDASDEAAADDRAGVEGEQERCDYCRLRLGDPVVATHDGTEYRFCTEACRKALERHEHVFTEHHGFRRFSPGVAAVDEMVPDGVPRNSLVMLGDEAGTRTDAVQAELVWRALERGEPAVVVTFLEPPVSVVQTFATLDWNVLPALEEGRLHVLDCFTHAMSSPARMVDHMSDWNRHLHDLVQTSTTVVDDPTSIQQIENGLDDCLSALEMTERGVVVVDSLTEFGTLVQPVKAYQFVKDVRADVCKARFVPVFAGATVVGDGTDFPHDLTYLADGVVDIRLNPELHETQLVKELRVRKMNGVQSISRWVPYEFTPGRGLTPVAVARDDAAAERERDGADAGDERARRKESAPESGDEAGTGPPGESGAGRSERGRRPDADADPRPES